MFDVRAKPGLAVRFRALEADQSHLRIDQVAGLSAACEEPAIVLDVPRHDGPALEARVLRDERIGCSRCQHVNHVLHVVVALDEETLATDRGTFSSIRSRMERGRRSADFLPRKI